MEESDTKLIYFLESYDQLKDLYHDEQKNHSLFDEIKSEMTVDREYIDIYFVISDLNVFILGSKLSLEYKKMTFENLSYYDYCKNPEFKSVLFSFKHENRSSQFVSNDEIKPLMSLLDEFKSDIKSDFTIESLASLRDTHTPESKPEVERESSTNLGEYSHEERRDFNRKREFDGRAGGGGGEYQPRKSKIPFDVTNMTYEQYCWMHYSIAIESYRKSMSFNQGNRPLQMPPPQPGHPMMPQGSPFPGMGFPHQGIAPNGPHGFPPLGSGGGSLLPP